MENELPDRGEPDRELKITEQDILLEIEVANFRDERSLDGDAYQSLIDLVRFDNTLLHADRADELKELIESRLSPEMKEVFNEFGTHESVMADIREQCAGEIAQASAEFDLQIEQLDRENVASGQLDRDAAANLDKLFGDLTLGEEPVATEANRQTMIDQRLHDAYTVAMSNPPWPDPPGKHSVFKDSEPSLPTHGAMPEPAKKAETSVPPMAEMATETPLAAMDASAKSGPDDDYELDL